MKLLAICGSLREESNTNKLVKKVAEASGCEYELVYLKGLNIQPCTGCAACMMNEGQCPIDDDMQAVYEKLMASDGLIFGSPTYFMDVSGAVKSLIDRTMALNYRGVGPMYNPDMPWLGHLPHSEKPAVAVVTVAGAGHDHAMESLRKTMEDCYRVNLVAKLSEAVGMGDVDEMPEVLQRAEAAGKKLGAAFK